MNGHVSYQQATEISSGNYLRERPQQRLFADFDGKRRDRNTFKLTKLRLIRIVTLILAIKLLNSERFGSLLFVLGN